LIDNNYLITIGVVLLRFFAVAISSLASLFIAKTILLKINPEINTRKFFGI